MHTRRPQQHQPDPIWQRAALVLALVALLAVPATLVYGQRVAEWESLSGWADWSDECGPVEGTIPVADDAPPATMAQLARITEVQARDAALAALEGATVTEADLDDEDGFLVYEVELLKDGTEYEVTVDAGDGRVLCTERD